MTIRQPAPHLAGASDPELIARVRQGDTQAYEELFLRHREVALRLARRLATPERADDVCAEAFAKILDLLQRGKGPDLAFRSYLLTTVRTVHLNMIRAGRRENLVEDEELQGLADPVDEDAETRFDEGAIAQAFRDLPERWQSILWLTAVEGVSNEEIGRQLGIQPGAVGSLAFRARAGLRQAYLAAHLRRTASAECARTLEQLPSFLRGRLGSRRRAQVDAHLEGCTSCTLAAGELADVDRRLGALLGPVVAGSAALALWPASVGVPAAPVVAGVLTGTKALGGGLLGSLTTGAGVTKAAVAVGVAAAGIGAGTAVVLERGHHPPVRPDLPSAVAPVSPGVPAPTATGTPRPTRPTASHTATVSPPSAPPPSTVAQPGPTSPAAPAPSEPPAPPATADGVAVEPMSSERVESRGVPWRRVTIPVSGAVEGTRLTVTSTHTMDAKLRVPARSGWTCTSPRTDWIDNLYLGTTTTQCRYAGNGDGSPVRIDYWIGSPSTVRGVVASGADDPDPADNVGVLRVS